MHEKNIDVLHVEIPKGYPKGLSWVVMEGSPKFGYDGDIRARDSALADGPTHDGLYAIGLGCVDETVATLKGVNNGAFESCLILTSGGSYVPKLETRSLYAQVSAYLATFLARRLA